MARKILILTNNPRVQSKFAAIDQHACESYEHVLHQVRNRVHVGARILTHPLAGSVKPGETPYRSVAIDDQQGGLDMQSLEVIEGAIDRFNTMISCARERVLNEKILEDFQLIDYQLLKSGLEAIDPSLVRSEV